MPLAEWLVEEGIGEHRAVLLDGAEIAAARLHWPGSLVPGQVEGAKLVVRRAGTPRGAALFGNGERAHVDGLPALASEGSTIRLEVTRMRLSESGGTKVAQCRPSDKPLQPALGLAGQLRAEGKDARVVRRFPDEADWSGLWDEADRQSVEFTNGRLHLSPTPAMLLIDVDGEDDAVVLAKAAVKAIARTLRRFDLGGNIGIDFPTIPAKASRQGIDKALDEALADWPHERTAMNGFGFVQIVSRLERPSLLNLIAKNTASAKARALLRDAELIDEPGDILLSCVNWVAKAMKEEWLTELSRRTGRSARLEIDTKKADLESCFVQAVPR